nr:hypothetical protein BaRGS_008132 [Batillaria attramentaria]
MVAVLDDNDHVPRITNPTPANNSITLPNNTTVGSMILKVKAEDDDDPNSTVFDYKIEDGDSDSLFQIIKVTGELILAREIQPKDAVQHKLRLVVSDGGSRPMSATASLTIIIPAEGMRAAASANILEEPNFIIIVVIVSVTIFAALLIVAAICFIFRRDRKRRAGRAQQRQVKDKMYQAAQWVSTHSLPLGDANGSSSGHETSRGSDSTGDKKCKKEVSFSLDDDLEKEGDRTRVDRWVPSSPPPPPTMPDNNNLGDVRSTLSRMNDPVQTGSAHHNLSLGEQRYHQRKKPAVDGRFVFIGGKTSPGSNSTSCYESSDGTLSTKTRP